MHLTKTKKEFYKKLHERIVETGQKDICTVGDYYGIIETIKDYVCHNKKLKKKNTLPQTFFDMTEELNLIDVWRTLNPMEQKFTYYSNPHKSYSRIDMVWTNIDIGKEIEKIEILPNTWADHNPY
uniref:Endonuclease/exonuclease/phosphatase domain-containing protein n=1 Tax=Micrurus carvalhoi TaxID=3147026 RepID=A0A2H6ND72_9SAUR